MKKSFRITLAVFSLMSASSMAQEPWQLTGKSQQKGVGGEAMCLVGVPPKLDR